MYQNDGWLEWLANEENQRLEEINVGEIQLKEGDNKIRFTCKKNVNMKLDYFKIEPNEY